MFDQLKHLKDLRSQAKTLQDALAQETVTVEKNGVTLIMDGNQDIKELKINPDLTPADLENILPPLFKEAMDKVKKIMAQTMQSMGGLGSLGM